MWFLIFTASSLWHHWKQQTVWRAQESSAEGANKFNTANKSSGKAVSCIWGQAPWLPCRFVKLLTQLWFYTQNGTHYQVSAFQYLKVASILFPSAGKEILDIPFADSWTPTDMKWKEESNHFTWWETRCTICSLLATQNCLFACFLFGTILCSLSFLRDMVCAL